MVVANRLSRYHLAIEALHRVDRLRSQSAHVIDQFEMKLAKHHEYIEEHLEDMPEVKAWTWSEP